ncbi:cupin domain-containing protein [Oxalobacteraceae bacterium OM1]|nr:cupin domain-containing protein [Oxalobacteraceae bacterium OM1]
MRHTKVIAGLAVPGAFIAGLFASPVVERVFPDAHAASAPLMPAVIDLQALTHGDLPRTPNPEMNNRLLVDTDNATVAVQSGNVAKHIHPKTDEIQYIIEGKGAMWLGTERKEFKPGTLIIIPKGTAHGGTIVSEGPVKALAIKIPPQPKDDVVFVQ